MCQSMQAIDTVTTRKSLRFGVLLLEWVPEKVLALTIAAATAMTQTGISGGEDDQCARDLRPHRLTRRFLAPSSSTSRWDREQQTMSSTRLEHSMAIRDAAIMAVLLLVLGVEADQ